MAAASLPKVSSANVTCISKGSASRRFGRLKSCSSSRLSLDKSCVFHSSDPKAPEVSAKQATSAGIPHVNDQTDLDVLFLVEDFDVG